MHHRSKAREAKKEEDMKKFLLVSMAVLFVISLAVNAFAATLTDTVSVTANVKSSCSTAVPGAMSITVDPSSSSNQNFTVTTPATMECTKNKTNNVTATSLNGGAINVACSQSGITGFTLKAPVSALTIAYTFKCDPSIIGQGFSGPSKDVSFNIGGLVLGTDAQVADYSNGETYADTVTLTVTY
jgi:hypothetical protein